MFFRLCGLPMLLAPLRERRGDIRLLAEHFVRELTPAGQTVKLTSAALAKLERHPWPGNIRELRSVLNSAMLLRKGVTLDVASICFEPPMRHAPPSLEVPGLELPVGVTLEQMLGQVERQLIQSALRRHALDKDRAAQHLGLGRSTLYKKLKQWGLEQGEALSAE